MPHGKEKRLHQRVDVDWPTLLLIPSADLIERLEKNNSLGGPIAGITKNISLGGAFVHLLKEPIEDEFIMLINSSSHENLLSVIAKAAWSNMQNHHDDITSYGIGVQFVELSQYDRQFLHRLALSHP